MELIIIAAMAANGVIGGHHTIPWRIPEEMAHFKTTTMGFPVLMGRVTYASIGGPLHGRTNIVLSRDPDFLPHPEVRTARSLAEAIAGVATASRVFIIGGAQIYAQALPLADTLLLTRIAGDYTGDTWFPDFSLLPYVRVDHRVLPAAVGLTIETYRNQAPQWRTILPSSGPLA